ncbi:MAG: FAD assembly factor SdhE [Nevskia sp.]
MSDLSRIKFLCRRGMKELDVLLQNFLERHYAQASPEEQWNFLRLLEREDPDIWAWIVGQTPPPAPFADVVARLQRNA